MFVDFIWEEPLWLAFYLCFKWYLESESLLGRLGRSKHDPGRAYFASKCSDGSFQWEVSFPLRQVKSHFLQCNYNPFNHFSVSLLPFWNSWKSNFLHFPVIKRCATHLIFFFSSCCSCIPLYNFSYTYDYILSTPTSFVDR